MATSLKRIRTSPARMSSNQGVRELKRVKTNSAKSRDVPKHQDLVDYKHAVAGHDGTMCDADGELFVKPCTQAEVDFYESTKFHPDFAELIPVFCGSLTLLKTTTADSIHQQLPDLIDHAEIPEGLKGELKSHMGPGISPAAGGPSSLGEQLTTDAPSQEELAAESTPRPGAIKTDRAIALLNASYGFKKPNIMDTKMGQQLWSNDASPEKKARFDKITESTTHKRFGFRIAGMQVYKGSLPTYKTAEGTEEPSANVQGPNEEGFTMYSKLWGRDDVNDGNVMESLKLFMFNEAAGIDEDLGKLVAGLFARDLRKVEAVLRKEECRMYSSSLLFVFEGDGPSLRAAIEEAKTMADDELEQDEPEAITPGNKRGAPRAVSANLRVDSGIGMDDEELDFVAGSAPSESEMGEESEDGDDDEEMSSFPHIYTLKMIDFAHSEWTPGLGPDEGLLLGVESLASFFEELSN
ncbi:SAICAR synthase-like protein [Xylaria sp. CBS 124048]|nr:SAICAR synthase-like protein [Xylaria sp. CBS 124048]